MNLSRMMLAHIGIILIKYSSKQVDKGLYGAFIVEDKNEEYENEQVFILDQHLFWNVVGLGWEIRDRPEQIVQNVLDHIQDGSIILLHELGQTVLILNKLISSIHT